MVRAVRGPQHPDGNFTDNSDGTVTADDTGLMWQQDKSAVKLSWDAVLTYCENLTLAGYDDWRLPNVIELRSIVDYTTFDPAINTTYFPDDWSSIFWSSTSSPWTRPSSPNNDAWNIVSLYNGFITFGNSDKDTETRYGRCVREGVPPTVTSNSPADGSSNIAVGSTITATFSEDMDASTITASTFLVNDGSGNIAGTVTYAGTTATLTPAANLNTDTGYTVTITNGAKDLLGNSLQTDYSWSFSTPDLIPPVVTLINPLDSATDVAVDTAITTTFSEPMNASTITNSTFIVNDGSGNITGTISYAGTTATFIPAANLDYTTAYTVTITTGAEDLAGNALTADYSWSFTTLADTTPPAVTSTIPSNGATDVATNTIIDATFSEPMDAATITSSNFTVNDGSSNISGVVSYNATTATFTPTADLNYDTVYTITITTAAQDLAGNAMQTDYSWSFTSGSAPDTTPPVVNSTSPVDAATVVSCDSPILVTFSEPMNTASINGSTFTLSNGVTGTVSCDTNAMTATFAPTSALDFSTTYTATITTSVEDQASNQLQAEYIWTFTTESAATTSDDFMVNGKFGGDGNGCVISSTASDYQVSAPVAIITVLVSFFLSVLVIFIKWRNRQHIR